MKINIKRLNHIQICIPKGSEKTARQFYTGLLQLEEIEKPYSLKGRGGFWLKVAGIEIHIGTEEITGKSKRHPAFEVENVDVVKSFLKKNGVETKDEIPIPGVSRFSLFDPFGNRIEFLERVDS